MVINKFGLMREGTAFALCFFHFGTVCINYLPGGKQDRSVKNTGSINLEMHAFLYSVSLYKLYLAMWQ